MIQMCFCLAKKQLASFSLKFLFYDSQRSILTSPLICIVQCAEGLGNMTKGVVGKAFFSKLIFLFTKSIKESSPRSF